MLPLSLYHHSGNHAFNASSNGIVKRHICFLFREVIQYYTYIFSMMNLTMVYNFGLVSFTNGKVIWELVMVWQLSSNCPHLVKKGTCDDNRHLKSMVKVNGRSVRRN